MKLIQTVRVLAFSALVVIPAHAMFIQIQTQKVPVARLVSNLEKQIADKPTNASLQSTLARLHSMAYAQKAEQLEAVSKNQPRGGVQRIPPTEKVEPAPDDAATLGSLEPWFGYTDRDHPPRQIKKGVTPEVEAEAKKHLQLAIAGYEKALTIDPKHLASRLGLGWCYDQSGDKTNALTHYRMAITQAWAKEGKSAVGGMDTPITSETVDYMLPLLNPTKDADEITQLKEYKARTARVSPSRAV